MHDVLPIQLVRRGNTSPAAEQEVLVQIGKSIGKLFIGRIPYLLNKAALHTAGAAAQLRSSFARSN